MNKPDGMTLATAAAALLMSSTVLSPAALAEEDAEPVKVSHCQGIEGASGVVAISSGHAMLSRSLCQRAGGEEMASISVTIGANISQNPAVTEVSYCNNLFTCNAFSACKGNGNANCAGKNSCHGIGFVGISNSDLQLTQQLCEKLGGSLISSL